MSDTATGILALELNALRVAFALPEGGQRQVIDGIDVRLERGKALSLLGISGVGKTVVSRMLIGLAPAGAIVEGQLRRSSSEGQVDYPLADALSGLPPTIPALAHDWGRGIAYVPQGGTRNLNPALTIGDHFDRARKRSGVHTDDSNDLELLGQMGFADPRRVWTRRPGVLSEGMARRVLLALALAGSPDIVVLDEPTTGLDSERRAQIAELLEGARARLGFGMLMVTHDVGDAARLTETGVVLADGKLVDELTMADGDIQNRPQHPAATSLVDAWRWRDWEGEAP